MAFRTRLICLLFITGGLAAGLSPAAAKDCSRQSVGLIPLTDLGAGMYQGYTGGLYPGGVNVRPAAHEAAGEALAAGVVPLDASGRPSWDGRIVLISIGMSNATQEFSAFVPLAMSDPERHPRLLVVDCASGGQTAHTIIEPQAPYWGWVNQLLGAAGATPEQVQVAWILEGNPNPSGSFLEEAQGLQSDLEAIIQVLEEKLPNLKLVYVSSRIYAGYATSSLNPEPYAYESGFSVQWLIASQIQGTGPLNYDPARGPVTSPWLSWGPYLWADGSHARSDGLKWTCGEFEDDGTHPGPGGETKVASLLLDFFKHDPTTRPWFLAQGSTGLPDAHAPALSVRPNPTAGFVDLRLAAPVGAAWKIEVLDVAGRRVGEAGRGVSRGDESLTIDLGGLGLGRGVYWLVMEADGRRSGRRVTLID